MDYWRLEQTCWVDCQPSLVEEAIQEEEMSY